MNGFERRKELKKESIRQAAIELFKTYGFKRVSIGDIARKANVSHVSIYNHFGSKDGLVKDVVTTVLSNLVAKSEEVIHGDLPYAKKLESIIFSKAELAGQYQGELMKAVVRDYPEMQQVINNMWEDKIDNLVKALVNEGIEKGHINKDLSPQAIQFYFDMIRQSTFVSPEIVEKLKMDSKLARDINQIFLFGLINKKHQAE